MHDSKVNPICQDPALRNPPSSVLPFPCRGLRAGDSHDPQPGHEGGGFTSALGDRESQGSRGGTLIETWGEWLGKGYEWEWFFTLTFAKPIGEWGANRAFSRWVTGLRQELRHRLEWVRVTEYQRRGVPHYHGFMLNTDGHRRLHAKDLWEQVSGGYARVARYDHRRDASYYLSKYVVKDLERGTVVFSRSLMRFYKTAQVQNVERLLGRMEILDPRAASSGRKPLSQRSLK